MESRFIPQDHEEKIYSFWEKGGYFTASSDTKKNPFSIILPPPNANANLHVGHAMYVYEDIMIRYNKLLGKETLWLPGSDHAGIETQFVFEKHLVKEGKSRFDFERETLFKMIWNFVMENRGNMENQLRSLGFALDWKKMKFTMDEDVVSIVHKTFKRMFDEGLIYRDSKLVNYCWKDGTSFSDLEVEDKEIPETATVEAEGGLFEIEYQFVGESRSIRVATTRPETMFGDVAVMVHPQDPRYADDIGKNVIIPIINKQIPIIADEYVDPKFGTGAVKVTPLHDFNDFEVGKRHGLKGVQVIGFDGKIFGTGTKYDGLRVIPARLAIQQDLNLEVKKHSKVIKVCYKCGKTLEPLPKEQWFIKIRPLADRAVEAVEKGEIEIYPARFKKTMIDWLNKFHDWNISRQIVWGIRIPAYRCTEKSEWFVSTESPTSCQICGNCEFEQDTDTFDTWFSSSQWPFVTLQTQSDKGLFEKFYPTSVMETGYDILPAWVVRMTMMGLYVTGKVPFKTVFLHGMVRDKKGLKMSKSKGNVVNPMDMVAKFGADALRGTLIFQSKEGGDVNFSEDKIIGMRNFTNKVWNIGRFILLSKPESGASEKSESNLLSELEKEVSQLQKDTLKHMNSYKFSLAFDSLYEWLWHRFADYYIEELKDEVRSGKIEVWEKLSQAYLLVLVMLHPFIPFVTEAIWKEFHGEDSSILDQQQW